MQFLKGFEKISNLLKVLKARHLSNLANVEAPILKTSSQKGKLSSVVPGKMQIQTKVHLVELISVKIQG